MSLQLVLNAYKGHFGSAGSTQVVVPPAEPASCRALITGQEQFSAPEALSMDPGRLQETFPQSITAQRFWW